MKYLAFLRVDVFLVNTMSAFVQLASTKAYNLACCVEPWEDKATSIAVFDESATDISKSEYLSIIKIT